MVQVEGTRLLLITEKQNIAGQLLTSTLQLQPLGGPGCMITLSAFGACCTLPPHPLPRKAASSKLHNRLASLPAGGALLDRRRVHPALDADVRAGRSAQQSAARGGRAAVQVSSVVFTAYDS